MSRFLVIEKGYLLNPADLRRALKSKTDLSSAKPIIDRMYIENWVLVQPSQMLEKKYQEKYQSLYNEVHCRAVSTKLTIFHILISVQITPLQDNRAVGSILDNDSLLNEINSHFQTKQKEKTVRRARNPKAEKRHEEKAQQ